jgi:imidazolonepropionase-like amidohydrolase
VTASGMWNRTWLRWSVLLAAIVAAPILSSGQVSRPTRTTVMNHVAVVDVIGGVTKRDMAVVITGNRITAVEPAQGTHPVGAAIVDATGKFVVPGLADMHHHLDTDFSLPGARGARRAGPEDFRRYLTHMLGWGFTTIFSPAHTYADLGDFTDLRRASQAGESSMARYFGVGRGITVEGGHASQPPLASFLPKTPEEAREQVRQLKTAGVDAVKFILEDLRWHGKDVSVMRRDIMQAIIDEAHAQQLKAYAHAPSLERAKEVLRDGGDGLVHSVVDAPVDDEFIGLMRKNRASYTTTLSLFAAFTDIEAWMRRLEALDHRGVIPKEVFAGYRSPEGTKRYYEMFGTMTSEQPVYLRNNLRKVADAGLLVVAGTDTNVSGVLLGISSQMELVLLVEAGLTPAETLRAATINAARLLGRDAEQGTVEAGKLADLIVLDADPLLDIRNVTRLHRVVKDGVIFDPVKLLAGG